MGLSEAHQKEKALPASPGKKMFRRSCRTKCDKIYETSLFDSHIPGFPSFRAAKFARQSSPLKRQFRQFAQS